MAKIKYQGAITKFLAMRAAKANRALFQKAIFTDIQAITKQFPVQQKIDISLVSFSSKNDFLEQVLSILSFLRYAGTPLLWTIYSDGSHTQEHASYFEKNLPFVKLVLLNVKDTSLSTNVHLASYKSELLDYARSSFPLGKKLFFYLNHDVQSPTIFLDSDILFYDKAGTIHLLTEDKPGWFLPEWIWGTLDQKYKEQVTRTVYQVNSGFFKIDHQPDAMKGLEYLKSLDKKYEYYTEQTVFHIILSDNRFFPLDPREYYLNNNDQFDWGYNFDRSQIAIRHYTSPVRHKMWQRDWEWQLSIT